VDGIVMVAVGPNARKDSSLHETEELFYQLEGSIKVLFKKTASAKKWNCIPVICILIPQNSAFSVPKVLLACHRTKDGDGFTDGLLWFCDTVIIS
jgi:3-hydroxyanthranilate 3,4-dioxygenase